MITQPHYLERLNTEQRSAVESLDGPLLVLAGAGTGKTRVLTTRIAHLIHTKTAFPNQILAVTFTNKAATEMKERVERHLCSTPHSSHSLSQDTPPAPPPGGERRGGMPQHSEPVEGDTKIASLTWLGTFHSIAARILRRHAEAVGLTSTFTILDDDDQRRLIKQLMAELNIDNKQFSSKVVISIIQSWKDKALLPEKLGTTSSGNTMEDVALRLYHAYQPRLKQLNACDFGDLTLHNLTIFQTYPDIAQQYAQRFRYILVDEYQDTNTAQYLWLRLLALGHKNICCVGDDDQSIYGWRGAEVGNILKFEQDFPECEVIRLERNYRSTGNILAAASYLISNNKQRLGKTLWTEDNEGELVRIKSVWDDAEEARFVGEEVESFQRDQISLDDMAILVRAGYQTRAFEERFMTLGVPYRVVGGLRFYERMEIRDAVAYLRVVHQPKDDLAFERIMNTPKRGVGKVCIEQLHTYAREHNCSLFEATRQGIAHFLRGKAKTTLTTLMEQFTRWQSLLDTTELPTLADQILDESGYKALWENDKTPEAPGRLENLKELIRALEEFPTLTEFLEHVGLVSALDEAEDGQMVSIMTLHAAKGLEFNCVFLTGWEEGLFPSQRSMDEKGTKGLEEERRLAYVGITRARQHCIISHAANRRMYNQWQSALPSRFIGELPEEHIEIIDNPLHVRRSSGPQLFQQELEDVFADTFCEKSDVTQSKKQYFSGRPGLPHQTALSSQNIEEPVATAYEDYPQDNTRTLTNGSRVFHQKFGYGVILNSDGDNLEIAFKHAGKKKVMADYVEVA